MTGVKEQGPRASRRATARRQRPTRQHLSGEARLRAALRRLGCARLRLPPTVLSPFPGREGGRRGRSVPSPFPPREGGRVGRSAGEAEARRWWPRLTPPQVQALLGAAITLALLLWDQFRQRLGQP